MNVVDLRRAFLDLLTDIRSAGRGVSQGAIGELFDRRLPAMVSAFDGHAEERVAQTSRDRMLRSVVAATRARIELHGEPSESLNGQAHGILRPWKRATRLRPTAHRWSLGLGLAGVAALAMVGWMLYSALNKPMLVKHKPKSGASAPIPIGPEKQPEGPVVRDGTPPEKKPVPKAGPRRLETLVAAKPLEVGKLVSVMGEPMVYAAGSKRGVVAVPGMKVAMGSTFETGDADRIEVKFNDGTVLRSDFNTRYTIQGATKKEIEEALNGRAIPRPERVDLQSGRLYAQVTHLENRSRFMVETPAATAEVLGTEFGLRVEKLARKLSGPEYKTTLQVKSGKVRFFNSFGEQTATDRTESWATEGTMPSEPQRIEKLNVVELLPGHRWTVTSSRLDPIEAAKRLGRSIGNPGLDVATFEPGVVKVTWSRRDSLAYEAGIRTGDRLLAVDGQTLVRAEQYYARTYLRPAATVRLSVERMGQVSNELVQTGIYQVLLPHVPEPIRRAHNQAAAIAIRGDTQTALARFVELADRTRNPAAYNGAGVVHEMQDEMGPAIRAYRRAVLLDPKASLYRLNLGLALRKIGNFERSLEELLEAYSLQPEWAKAATEAARAYEFVGRNQDGLALIEEAIRSRPEDVALLTEKCRRLMVMRRMGEAKAVVERIFELEPDLIFAWNHLAEIHHSEGNLAAAAEAYDRMLAIDPTSAGGWWNYGLVLYTSGRYSEAEVALRKCLRIDPDFREALTHLAKTLRRMHRPAEAVSMLQSAVLRLPRSSALQVELGATLQEMGNLQEAENCFLRAIELEPEDPSGHGNLAMLRTRQGRHEEALELSLRAVALRPDWVAAQNNLGNAYLRLNRTQEAEDAFRRAMRLNPRDWVSVFNLGRLKHFGGNPAEGERLYREALAIAPTEPEILNNLGALARARGDLKEAEVLWRKAVSHGPRHLFANRNLADLLLSSGRPGEAIDFARAATSLAPQMAQGWIILGWALKDTGNGSEAEPAFRRAAEVEPNNLGAVDSLLLFLLLEERATPEIAQLAEIAQKMAPENPTVLLHVGWALGLSKQYDKAEPLLVRSLVDQPAGRDPFHAPAWAVLGEVFEATNRRDRAIEAYRTALSLRPTEPRALAGLKRLGG